MFYQRFTSHVHLTFPHVFKKKRRSFQKINVYYNRWRFEGNGKLHLTWHTIVCWCAHFFFFFCKNRGFRVWTTGGYCTVLVWSHRFVGTVEKLGVAIRFIDCGSHVCAILFRYRVFLARPVVDSLSVSERSRERASIRAYIRACIPDLQYTCTLLYVISPCSVKNN